MFRERGFWGLALLGLAFFHRPLFFDQVFFFRDLSLSYLPLRRFGAELLRAGEWPVWNPYLHGGFPFAADLANSFYYPSQLLHLILPGERAMSLEIAGHVIFSAVASYLLARILGLRQSAATVSGLVFGFCGFTLSQANLFIRLLAQPYLPLLVLFWHLFLVEKRRRWLLLAIVCGALQVFAGAAESVAFGFAIALGWGLVLPADRKTRLQRIGLFFALGVGAAGLASIQLIPAVEMVSQSKRGEGLELDVVGNHSIYPQRLPELVIPNFLGRTDLVSQGDFWGSQIVDDGYPMMLNLYWGLVPVALVLLAAGGAVRGSRRLDLYLTILAFVALLLAFGRFLPFFEALYRWVPGVQIFRYPVKYLTLGVLPMALLAGRGFEMLFSRDSDSVGRRATFVAWGVTAGLGLFVVSWNVSPGFAANVQEVFFGGAGDQITEGLRGPLLQVFGVWLLAVLIVQLFRSRVEAWIPWVLVAVVALDLAAAGRTVNPTVTSDHFFQAPPAAEIALQYVEDGRLYRHPAPDNLPLAAPTGEIVWLSRWFQEILQHFIGAWYGLPVIYHADYHGLAPSRVMRLKWTVESMPWERRLPLLSAASVRLIITHEEIDLPGVERLTAIDNASGVPFFVYRNHLAADRVELIPYSHRVADLDEAVAAMVGRGFDPRIHAVVEGFTPPPPSDCRDEPKIEMVETDLRIRRVAVESRCPGALVFSETYYPGWEARVNGRRVSLYRANAAFQAVWLEPGSHQVELRYIPRSLYWGVGISLLTLLVLIWFNRHRPVMPQPRRG